MLVVLRSDVSPLSFLVVVPSTVLYWQVRAQYRHVFSRLLRESGGRPAAGSCGGLVVVRDCRRGTFACLSTHLAGGALVRGTRDHGDAGTIGYSRG